MLQIKLHTHWLDVDKNTTIQWEIENPLFTQGELLGDVSGNFSVPATPNNATAFSFCIVSKFGYNNFTAMYELRRNGGR